MNPGSFLLQAVSHFASILLSLSLLKGILAGKNQKSTSASGYLWEEKVYEERLIPLWFMQKVLRRRLYVVTLEQQELSPPMNAIMAQLCRLKD